MMLNVFKSLLQETPLHNENILTHTLADDRQTLTQGYVNYLEEYIFFFNCLA